VETCRQTYRRLAALRAADRRILVVLNDEARVLRFFAAFLAGARRLAALRTLEVLNFEAFPAVTVRFLVVFFAAFFAPPRVVVDVRIDVKSSDSSDTHSEAFFAGARFVAVFFAGVCFAAFLAGARLFATLRAVGRPAAFLVGVRFTALRAGARFFATFLAGVRRLAATATVRTPLA